MLTCPRCHFPLGLDERDAGTTVACKGCGLEVAVPVADGSLPALPAAPPGNENSAATQPPATGTSFLLWLILLGVVLVVVLIAAFRPPYSGARVAAWRNLAINRAKQIGIAMANYETRYGTWPAAYSADPRGKPLLSWRVHLLPYLECRDLYEQFHLDEPWDSPHNLQLIDKMPEDVFGYAGEALPPGHTCFLAVIGPHTVIQPPFDEELGRPLPGVTTAMIPDGLANTILFLEVAPRDAVVWTKPDDYDYTLGPPSTHPKVRKSSIAGFADGRVRAFSPDLPAWEFRARFTRDGGERVAEE